MGISGNFVFRACLGRFSRFPLIRRLKSGILHLFGPVWTGFQGFGALSGFWGGHPQNLVTSPQVFDGQWQKLVKTSYRHLTFGWTMAKTSSRHLGFEGTMVKTSSRHLSFGGTMVKTSYRHLSFGGTMTKFGESIFPSFEFWGDNGKNIFPSFGF